MKIITEPTIVVLAEQQLVPDGLNSLVDWLAEFAPETVENAHNTLVDSEGLAAAALLLPMPPKNFAPQNSHSDNEALVELAGRNCYKSYGNKAGRKSNAEYLANLMGSPGRIPHASVTYHAKMTFFFAGISRRMTHELIRHYVGADRSEEGCPSQESTRYVEHPGHFIAHPRLINENGQVDSSYVMSMSTYYEHYCSYIASQIAKHRDYHNGEDPKGMDRKRIYEAASSYLPGSAATSMTWTTNPTALAKIFYERCDEASDLEFQRFAKALRKVCFERWPNLFRDSNPACADAQGV